MLSAHYRSPLTSAPTDGGFQERLERILTCVEKLRDLEAKASPSPRTAGEQENMEEADKLRGKVRGGHGR